MFMQTMSHILEKDDMLAILIANAKRHIREPGDGKDDDDILTNLQHIRAIIDNNDVEHGVQKACNIFVKALKSLNTREKIASFCIFSLLKYAPHKVFTPYDTAQMIVVFTDILNTSVSSGICLVIISYLVEVSVDCGPGSVNPLISGILMGAFKHRHDYCVQDIAASLICSVAPFLDIRSHASVLDFISSPALNIGIESRMRALAGLGCMSSASPAFVNNCIVNISNHLSGLVTKQTISSHAAYIRAYAAMTRAIITVMQTQPEEYITFSTLNRCLSYIGCFDQPDRDSTEYCYRRLAQAIKNTPDDVEAVNNFALTIARIMKLSRSLTALIISCGCLDIMNTVCSLSTMETLGNLYINLHHHRHLFLPSNVWYVCNPQRLRLFTIDAVPPIFATTTTATSQDAYLPDAILDVSYLLPNVDTSEFVTKIGRSDGVYDTCSVCEQYICHGELGARAGKDCACVFHIVCVIKYFETHEKGSFDCCNLYK